MSIIIYLVLLQNIIVLFLFSKLTQFCSIFFRFPLSQSVHWEENCNSRHQLLLSRK